MKMYLMNYMNKQEIECFHNKNMKYKNVHSNQILIKIISLMKIF